MTREELIAWAKAHPDSDGFVAVNAKHRKRTRNDGNRDKLIRVPRECGEAFEEMLRHVSAKLGSQAREVQIEFVTTVVEQVLNGE